MFSGNERPEVEVQQQLIDYVRYSIFIIKLTRELMRSRDVQKPLATRYVHVSVLLRHIQGAERLLGVCKAVLWVFLSLMNVAEYFCGVCRLR